VPTGTVAEFSTPNGWVIATEASPETETKITGTQESVTVKIKRAG
jgi:hypothetical protein